MNTFTDQDTKIAKRRTTYCTIATELALMSDQHLLRFVENSTPICTNIGGTASFLTIGSTRIFVKKVRLTDIEKQPENILSTANLFGLPTYYQYGIGSLGFGVWRELAAHIMTTNWILTGECVNFPLLYHWRKLPRLKPELTSAEQLNEIDRDVEFWEGSSPVRLRLEQALNASADIVLFLEYFPENLDTWLGKQIAKGGDIAESACAMVESNLKAISSFINSRGLLHFDAHFMNILTDGQQLYFADFGLATCTRFELSEAESDFFKKHLNYDQCYTYGIFC